MQNDSKNRMFPVGLYGTLLAGLFGVTFPGALAPIESAARTLVCLPLRAYSLIGTANPVLANTTDPGPPTVLDDLGRATRRAGRGPIGFLPKVFRVRESRSGPLGTIDELVLDATVGELRGAAAVVTVGDALIGHLFLGGADQDRARVRLLTYHPRSDPRDFELRVGERAPPPRVAAQVSCREVDGRDTLHFLVEPARSIDPWPLRCTLLDDSYLASRLRESGAVVTTAKPNGESSLPAGMTIGRLMIWGYPKRGIPVGLFVAPAVDPRSISAVTLWRPGGSDRGPRSLQPAQVGRFLPVWLSRYPAPRPVKKRWLVTSTAGAVLPDGAALVDSGRFLGRLHAPWSGQSLVTPFQGSTRTWTLVLRTSGGGVVGVVGRIIGTEPDGRLRLKVAAPSTLEAGQLFTGINGLHCPAGFYIGVATPGLGPVLLVEVAEQPVRHPEVFLLHLGTLKAERDR